MVFEKRSFVDLYRENLKYLYIQSLISYTIYYIGIFLAGPISRLRSFGEIGYFKNSHFTHYLINR